MRGIGTGPGQGTNTGGDRRQRGRGSEQGGSRGAGRPQGDDGRRGALLSWAWPSAASAASQGHYGNTQNSVFCQDLKKCHCASHRHRLSSKWQYWHVCLFDLILREEAGECEDLAHLQPGLQGEGPLRVPRWGLWTPHSPSAMCLLHAPRILCSPARQGLAKVSSYGQDLMAKSRVRSLRQPPALAGSLGSA